MRGGILRYQQRVASKRSTKRLSVNPSKASNLRLSASGNRIPLISAVLPVTSRPRLLHIRPDSTYLSPTGKSLFKCETERKLIGLSLKRQPQKPKKITIRPTDNSESTIKPKRERPVPGVRRTFVKTSDEPPSPNSSYTAQILSSYFEDLEKV